MICGRREWRRNEATLLQNKHSCRFGLHPSPSTAVAMEDPVPDITALNIADDQSATDATGDKQRDKEAKKAAKAAEKAAKEAAKAARAAQRNTKAAVLTGPEEGDPLGSQYGDLPRIQSSQLDCRTWTSIIDLNKSLDGQKVLLRCRLHTSRGKGKSAFLVVRQQTATAQAILFVDDVTVSKGMVKYACAIPRESIIDLEGKVILPQSPVEGCTQSDVEIAITDIHVVSRAAALPFEVVDAARSEAEIQALEAKGDKVATVSQDTRLDNRTVDLRTPANVAIFRLQHAVCQLFRGALLQQGFMEIHTPKLISGASEGGAAVFHTSYFGNPACLAQSPQLYKQMAIAADFNRVFEIGPVFRAEDSNTHRHLCEFMGLDFEMAIKSHYMEVLDVINSLFVHIFEGLRTTYAHELSVVSGQYPAPPLRWVQENPRLTFEEGIQLLKDAGYDADPYGDLTTELERALGRIVADKYGTDFYMLHRYPLAVRPFYTMPSPDNNKYSNSFDVFIRGEEIISGAQRIHEHELLTDRAEVHGIPVDTIQAYIDSFKYGCPPHGGCGVGLERVVMLFCGLNNIRKTSLFPRDPKRLTP